MQNNGRELLAGSFVLPLLAVTVSQQNETFLIDAFANFMKVRVIDRQSGKCIF